MKKILILNSKGGSGKSNASIWLSAAFARAGLAGKVSLLDLDSQGTSKNAIERFTDQGVKLYDKEGPEPLILVIDTEGKSTFTELLQVAPEADLYIVTTSPSGDEVRISAKTVAYLQKMRPKSRVKVLFNRVEKSAADSNPEVLAEYARAIGADALTNVIHKRKVYDYAINNAEGWDLFKGVEREEWSKVATEVLAHLS